MQGLGFRVLGFRFWALGGGGGGRVTQRSLEGSFGGIEEGGGHGADAAGPKELLSELPLARRYSLVEIMFRVTGVLKLFERAFSGTRHIALSAAMGVWVEEISV